MSLNEEQEDYVRYLNGLPPEAKCGCGWYTTSECRHICPPKSPSQRPEDRLYMKAYQEGRKVERERANRIIDGSIRDQRRYAKDDPPERCERRTGWLNALHAVRSDINDRGRV